MKNRTLIIGTVLTLGVSSAFAQAPAPAAAPTAAPAPAPASAPNPAPMPAIPTPPSSIPGIARPGMRPPMARQGMPPFAQGYQLALLRVAANPALAREAGLSEDQMAKLTNELARIDGVVDSTRATYTSLRTQSNELIAKDNASEDAILALVQKMGEAWSEMEKQRTMKLLAVKQALTPEQIRKISSGMTMTPPPMPMMPMSRHNVETPATSTPPAPVPPVAPVAPPAAPKP